MVGIRIDCDVLGRARRFEGATRGGGMREEDAGLDGGAMSAGLLGGGGIDRHGIGPEARCAEFIAGNEGGGRLSSSSSSLSDSCSLSVKDGTGVDSTASFAVAFGVLCGDGLSDAAAFLSLRICSCCLAPF